MSGISDNALGGNGRFGKMSDREILVGIATEVKHIKKELRDVKDEFKNSLGDCREWHNKQIDANTRKVGELDSWKDKVNGALGVIGLLISAIIAKISKIL